MAWDYARKQVIRMLERDSEILLVMTGTAERF
jgi:hypothetical protein